MFLYPPLNDAISQTRLVRFIPGQDGDASPADISLELRSAPLGDEKYTYAALSYVWGNPFSEAKSNIPGAKVWGEVKIEVNGQPFTAKENLYDALVQLQRDGVSSWLWIDAICINQADIEEKTSQVGKMAAIFAGAQVVYMWLGIGCGDSDMLMDFVARVGARAVEAGALDLWPTWTDKEEIADYLRERPPNQPSDSRINDQDNITGRFLYDLLHEPVLCRTGTVEPVMNAGFEDVLQRSYWHRLWVIQEVVLARRAVVLCGSKSVPLDEFEAVCTAIWHIVHAGYRGLWPGAYQDFGGFLLGTLYDVGALAARAGRRDGKGVRVADIVATTGIGPGRPLYSVSDPRDIVYGLLGVVEDGWARGLVADYRRTRRDVFVRLTRSLMHDGMVDGGLYSLEYCVPREEAQGQGQGQVEWGLPSWVPDWVVWGQRGLRVYPVNYHPVYDASAGLGGPPDVLRPEEVYAPVLRWSGCKVDVVTEVMEPPELDDFSDWSAAMLPYHRAGDWCRSVLAFAGVGDESGPGEDYIWRTIRMAEYRSGAVLFHQGKGCSRQDTQHLAWLMRSILHQTEVDPETLTEEQKRCVNEGHFRFELANPELKTLEERLRFLMTDVPWLAASRNRGRTLFKTCKEMFGLGHVAIRSGDLVTLLTGCKAPIILRPRDSGGFEFVGDAYVDGIMQGEFLRNEHELEDFEIL